jgi:muramidase (phage lysozyme)
MHHTHPGYTCIQERGQDHFLWHICNNVQCMNIAFAGNIQKYCMTAFEFHVQDKIVQHYLHQTNIMTLLPNHFIVHSHRVLSNI